MRQVVTSPGEPYANPDLKTLERGNLSRATLKHCQANIQSSEGNLGNRNTQAFGGRERNLTLQAVVSECGIG